MDTDTAAKLGLAALAFALGLVQAVQAFSGRRARIKSDIDMYSSLPDGASAKPVLLESINQAILQLLADQHVKRRDPTGIVVAAILLALTVVLALVAFRSGGWWFLLLIPAVCTGLLGVVGMEQDVRKRERDEKGRPLKAPVAVLDSEEE